MPPKKRRSTGALRMALITSSGIALAAVKPSAAHASGGNAHFFVVVTGRTAGGESVVEPESVLLRDGVGDVGKRRRALVGGDHEIGIVIVVAHDVIGWNDLVLTEVVGNIEQSRNER